MMLVSDGADRRGKNRSCKLAAFGANCACGWNVFGWRSITKISLTQHLVMSEFGLKKKLYFWLFLKKGALESHCTHISTQLQSADASSCCYFLSGHVFPISSQSPATRPTPFYIPRNHYPWTLLHKEIVFMFQ